MDDLKPCPFCGGNANIERIGDSRVSTIVSCDECGCRLENGEEFNHGIGWNTRADTGALATQSARIAELEAEVDKHYVVVSTDETDQDGFNIERRIAWSDILLARATAAEERLAALTYSSTQATECAVCGDRKHTPLRRDHMGGYVCLTCVDNHIDAAEERIKEAERVIAPFAPVGAATMKSMRTDDATVWGYGDTSLTYGDLRAAAKFMEGKSDGCPVSIVNQKEST